MSIFDTLFGGAKTPAPQTPQQASPVGDPVTPGLPDVQTQQAQTPDPMESYKDLWKAPEQTQQQQPQSYVGLKPEDIAKSAQAVDFSQVVTPEMMTQISQGGEGAAKAFMQAMNSMAQASHAYSVQSSQAMVEKALAKAEQQFAARVPDMIRRNTVMEGIKENPVLSNPAVAPVVSAVAQQIAMKHPQASAAQVKKMAEDYIMNMSSAFGGTQQQSQQSQPSGPDWSSYL